MDDVTDLFTVGEWSFFRVESWPEWLEALDTFVDEASEAMDSLIAVELSRASRVSAARFPNWN